MSRTNGDSQVFGCNRVAQEPANCWKGSSSEDSAFKPSNSGDESSGSGEHSDLLVAEGNSLIRTSSTTTQVTMQVVMKLDVSKLNISLFDGSNWATWSWKVSQISLQQLVCKSSSRMMKKLFQKRQRRQT